MQARCISVRAKRYKRSPCPKRPIPKKSSGLCEDEQGRIWVGTFDGRFGWIEEDQITCLTAMSLYEGRAMLHDQDGVPLESVHTE